MKTIRIPEPVKLEQGPTVTFQQFVRDTLTADTAFGKTMADVYSGYEIRQRTAAATETLDLENADYERLLKVAREPSGGYRPELILQLVPFLRAIENAE